MGEGPKAGYGDDDCAGDISIMSTNLASWRGWRKGKGKKAVGLHRASAEYRHKHQFLPHTQIQLEEFGDRDDDNVYIDCDVVPRRDKPEDLLVDAVVIWRFGVPGCPRRYIAHCQ